MGIKLKVLSEPFPERPREAGSCWRYPPGDIEGRECWWIVLPKHPDNGKPGHPGEISWRTTDLDSTEGKLWDITGSPLTGDLTVTPSIDVLRFVKNPAYDFNKKPEDQPGVPAHIREGSYWHGFITNGELVG